LSACSIVSTRRSVSRAPVRLGPRFSTDSSNVFHRCCQTRFRLRLQERHSHFLSVDHVLFRTTSSAAKLQRSPLWRVGSRVPLHKSSSSAARAPIPRSNSTSRSQTSDSLSPPSLAPRNSTTASSSTSAPARRAAHLLNLCLQRHPRYLQHPVLPPRHRPRQPRPTLSRRKHGRNPGHRILRRQRSSYGPHLGPSPPTRRPHRLLRTSPRNPNCRSQRPRPT
jgi:hypothetical protein